MLFKNQSTGAEMNVSNVSMKDGRIFFSVRGKGCGKKFYNRNVCVMLDEEAENGTYLKVVDGWEVVNTPKRTKAKKENIKKDEVKLEEKHEEEHQEENVKHEEIKQEENTKETPKKEVKHENVNTDEDDARQLAAIFARMKGNNNIDMEAVRAMVREEVQNVAPRRTELVIKTVEGEEISKVDEPHPLLGEVLTLVKNDRAIGRFPWLHGPAGSGKSTLAKQVADALGLPFYSVSSLLQKYELEGYTDAAGELVETSFYKAMNEGGVFLFDEASTSSAEVQIAFNTALANLIYNFPKVGMCEAHPDFHIIAADNTTGRGGNNTYHARYEVEPSTLDRYTFVEIGYTDAHDLRMAQGDNELVEFIKAVRIALDKANLTYLASPRSSKAIKVYQALGMDDEKAVWLGLCSGWAKRDIELVAVSTIGCSDNKYYKAFTKIANRK